jgi:alkylhydroperoxidase family enzyme
MDAEETSARRRSHVMARIAPVPRKEWPQEMREAVAAMRPPVQRQPDPIRENRPQARNTLETFAHNPDLARAFFTFNGHVLFGTTLTRRQRQFLILRVAARRSSAYLWAQHVFQGRDAGLTDEEMARIAFGPNAPFFEPLETALLRAVDELVDAGVISDETWEVLASELDPAQLLDVVFTAGCYETVAWFFRSFDLEVDPEIPQMLQR